MDTANTGYERKVRRQLAILDVAEQVQGEETSDEITAMLRAALERRHLRRPPGAWLNAVARDISLGSVYVISSEVLAEAKRRLEHSRATAGSGEGPGAGSGGGIGNVMVDSPVSGRQRSLPAVLATPTGTGPWPAVVILPESAVTDEFMRSQLSRFAARGYLALMPDLFTSTRRPVPPSPFPGRRDRLVQDIAAARAYLVERADCDGAVAVLGSGASGVIALASASKGFDAVSVNCAKLPKRLNVLLEGACPLIASYGARQRSTAGSCGRLVKALDQKLIDHDVKVYPQAGRGLLTGQSSGPRWLPQALRAPVTGQQQDAAADAWQRTYDFFHRQLRNAPSTRNEQPREPHQ